MARSPGNHSRAKGAGKGLVASVKIVQFRPTATFRKAIEEHAERHGVTVSEAAREWCEAGRFARKLRALVEGHQWVSPPGDPNPRARYCPDCGALERDGHSSICALAYVLAQTK